MSDERKRSVVPWIAGVVALLAAYVLRIGPAIVWGDRNPANRDELFGRAYFPVLCLADQSEVSQRALPPISIGSFA